MPGEVRIIGGKWRGRKLKVPEVVGLRPTPDRVRETVFNWLNQIVIDANCLDAFAGSGALGFEALSRGAKCVTFFDESKQAVKALQEAAKIIGATNANIQLGQLPNALATLKMPFDIVFLDPPFQQNLLLPTCFFLEDHQLLAQEAYIYLESQNTLQQNDLPSTWELLKSKKAGQVSYHLAKRKVK